METMFDVVVVGGGLSGLATAAYLGKAGVRAVVIEKASELGGRARTTVEGGFAMNLGAHAVYRMGPAWKILEELEVPLNGGIPSASGLYGMAEDGLHTLPTGFLSLVTTGLLTLAAKMEVAKLLASLERIDAAALMSVPALEWIERTLKTPEARGFLKLFFRVSTYTGDLERLSAGAAISQLQLVSKHNVLYLDGGWQTLVEALRAKVEATGGTILAGDGVANVAVRAPGDVRVTLRDGRELRGRAVVLATGPHAAASVAPEVEELARLAKQATAVKVAVLDVALSKWPRPKARAAFGTERATYVAVHSAVAKLAPEGGALVHALHYSPSGDARADEEELEAMIDALQPGWREHVVERRFLPAMVASNDLAAAARGGYAGRPDVAVKGAEGVFLAGDWVGGTGMLLDAALSSAKRAAMECAAMVRGVAKRGARDAVGTDAASQGGATRDGAARGRERNGQQRATAGA